jgi:predicted nucleic acid-binding protein
MKFLLDVNTLIALGFREHVFHERVAHWFSNEGEQCLTCSITELGFVRVLAQAPQYALNVSDARTLLYKLKVASGGRIGFISDGNDIQHLPAWIRFPLQLTDGHLSRLAASNSAVLATLNAKIPDALLIPD